MEYSSFTFELIKVIIQCITLAVAIWGGYTALVEYRDRTKTTKALRLNDIIQQLRFDDDIREVIRMIEWDDFVYDVSFYKSGLEKKADKTFEYLSYFCYLLDSGIIGEKEFSFLKYEVLTVLNNKQVQLYFYNLYHYTRIELYEKNSLIVGNQTESEVISIPFQYLMEYGIKNGIIKSDLYSFDNPEFQYILGDMVL